MYISLPEQPGGEKVPASSLCAFTRVFLEVGHDTSVSFRVEGYPLQVVRDDGSRVPAVGMAVIHVGGFSPGGSSSTTTLISAKVQLASAASALI